MSAYSAAEWSDLFVATAGASAALTGLVFVAVSINLDRILSFAGLPERALETLALLLAVTIVSIFGLAPGQSATALGIELLGFGLLALLGVALAIRASVRASGRGEARLYARVTTSAPGLLAFVIGGASLIAESGGGLYWVLGGIIIAVLGGVANAWVLLVEILR